VLLYIERWLKAPVQMEDGSVVPRTAGTPQGGVIVTSRSSSRPSGASVVIYLTELKLLFLNAWTKTPQGWKFVAWQSTPLPA
jgi:hypothetical protein